MRTALAVLALTSCAHGQVSHADLETMTDRIQTKIGHPLDRDELRRIDVARVVPVRPQCDEGTCAGVLIPGGTFAFDDLAPGRFRITAIRLESVEHELTHFWCWVLFGDFDYAHLRKGLWS